MFMQNILIEQAGRDFYLLIFDTHSLFVSGKNFKDQSLSEDVINNQLIEVTMGWQWFWKKSADENSQNNHNDYNNQQPTTHSKSYYKEYSSQRTCVPDEEDQNYQICTEKIKDGNNTYQKKQRVPANQGYNSSVRTFSSSFLQGDPNNTNTFFIEHFNPNSFQKQFEEFNNFFTTFFSFPFGMPFAGTHQPNAPREANDFFSMQYRNPFRGQQFPRQSQKHQQYNENRYFFSQKQKDYDIKDI